MTDDDTIAALEERLCAAMTTSDVEAIDRLLDDASIFTDQSGAMLSKGDDLSVHRSGRLAIDRFDVTDRTIRRFGDAAVVTFRAMLVGRYDGAAFGGAYAYTRMWCRINERWRVVAAQCSAVAG